MPQFTSYQPGTPCWVDLMSPDTDASGAFYSKLFGWDVEALFDDQGNGASVEATPSVTFVDRLTDEPLGFRGSGYAGRRSASPPLIANP